MPEFRNEADKIYRCLFEKTVPDDVAERYSQVIERIERIYPDDVRDVRKCIEQCKDLEALEIYARHTGKLPLLSAKFKIMVFLAETLPENYGQYINERDRVFLAYILLGTSVIRTAFKFIRGAIAIRVLRQ
ncbi:MAG: hypothetical protein ISR96_12260 [Nitrospira sp.]|nr:hypothetical protein [bacterium]MBL7050278.1 hypothetical protein [Nitrospira sp.]